MSTVAVLCIRNWPMNNLGERPAPSIMERPTAPPHNNDKGNLWWLYANEGEFRFIKGPHETMREFRFRMYAAIEARYDIGLRSGYDWRLHDEETGEIYSVWYHTEKLWVVP